MSVSANRVGMEECKEYRLSGCSTSTLCRSSVEFSIYDTYAKDWNCMSARSTCTRSVCQSEFDDPSELTLVLKERRLTQSQLSNVSSDDSTEPPTEYEPMGDTGGSTTPVTSRERSSSFDQFGIVSRQATAAADSATESGLQASLKTAIVTLAEGTPSALIPRFANASPPVILAKPVVANASLTPQCPSADTPQSFRNSARDPFLSFRSYDSVHMYGSCKGQTSGYSSRCHSWAPPSLHARECQVEPSELFSADKANDASIDSGSDSATSSRRACLERMISSNLKVKRSLTHQGSMRSEVGVVDCCRIVPGSASRSFSAVSHAELDSHRVWSEQEAESSSGRYLLNSNVEDTQDTVGTRTELRSQSGIAYAVGTRNRFGHGSVLRSQSAIAYAESHKKRYGREAESLIITERLIPPSSSERHFSSSDLEITCDARGGSVLRSQSAIGYAESHQKRYSSRTEPRIISERSIPPSSSGRHLSSSDLEITCDARGGSVLRSQSAIAYAESHLKRTEPRIVAERSIPPSSPERHFSSSDLEMTRDRRGVQIGFRDASRDRILRSSSLEVTEDSRGVSFGFREDHCRSSTRSHSWVPPTATCESTRRPTSQSWAPPLIQTACDTSHCLISAQEDGYERREISRGILRPLPSSRVSSLDRPPREILRPVASSHLSSLDRPQRETSRDILRPLHPSRIHSLAPPPDRQVRHAPTEPDTVFRRQRLPSPPRRKVRGN